MKALKQDPSINLLVADANPHASGKAIHPHFYQIPKASDSGFIDHIYRICDEQKVDVLLPLVTRELEVLAPNKERFLEIGTRIVVSDAQQLHAANDKLQLMQSLKQAGIPVAEFYTATSASEIAEHAHKLGYPNKKVCIKPALSNGSRGMRILDAGAGSFEAFFEQKPGNTHTTLESILQLFGEKPLPTMLVMEFLPGEEYTADALLDNGEPLLLLPRKRIAMNNGISVAGVFEENREIMEYATRVFRCMKLHGPNGLQVKRGEDGKFYILEINPRLQGSTTTAMGMGINLPVLAVKQAVGEDVKTHIPQPQWGLRFVRYYEDAFFTG
ncbi:MAG: ATP-grasp domain-containing protein [Sphingomonadales bacterium]